jgi:hypothetical protein
MGGPNRSCSILYVAELAHAHNLMLPSPGPWGGGAVLRHFESPLFMLHWQRCQMHVGCTAHSVAVVQMVLRGSRAGLCTALLLLCDRGH